VELDQARREMLRWQVLHILNYCRENWTSDRQILLVIEDEIACSPHELHQEMVYLESKKLLVIDRKTNYWQLKIDADGVDFVEHNSAAIVGIARPDKYWR
jgi:glycosylphosphatidylinositol transamidase (GPIT) subunit GPI8